MKKRLLALVLTLCLSFCLLVPARADYTPEEQYAILGDILRFLDDNSYDLDGRDRETLLMEALEQMFRRSEGSYEMFMDALLSLFDDHTMYIPEGRYEDSFASGGTVRYVGVGITMALEEGGVRVAEVAHGGPAEAAGVQVGDLIVAAGGHMLAGLSLEEIRPFIVGEDGTSVELTLVRRLKRMTVTVQRAVVEQKTFDSYELEPGVYYMDYNNFADTDDYISFVFAMQDMIRAESKVLILDLRGNPGGQLNFGLSMLNRLIPDAGRDFFGTETRVGDQLITDWVTSEGLGPRLNRIFILQDKGTASTAEVVTASLHDLGYATTIGDDSYGKARMQNHLVFTDGSAAVITIGRLVPPSQLDYEHMGLYPDWLLPELKLEHPAAKCELLDFSPIPMQDFSPNGRRLNEALIALGYMKAEDVSRGIGYVDENTMAALRRFQDDYGLMHRSTPDAHSLEMLNQLLLDVRATGLRGGDRQLEKALELARPYLEQPLRYTVDELGNFRNLQ